MPDGCGPQNGVRRAQSLRVVDAGTRSAFCLQCFEPNVNIVMGGGSLLFRSQGEWDQGMERGWARMKRTSRIKGMGDEEKRARMARYRARGAHYVAEKDAKTSSADKTDRPGMRAKCLWLRVNRGTEFSRQIAAINTSFMPTSALFFIR